MESVRLTPGPRSRSRTAAAAASSRGSSTTLARVTGSMNGVTTCCVAVLPSGVVGVGMLDQCLPIHSAAAAVAFVNITGKQTHVHTVAS